MKKNTYKEAVEKPLFERSLLYFAPLLEMGAGAFVGCRFFFPAFPFFQAFMGSILALPVWDRELTLGRFLCRFCEEADEVFEIDNDSC